MTQAKLVSVSGVQRLLLGKEVADMLGVSVRTVEYWRQNGGGPVYCKFGRLVRYRMADVAEFQKGREKPKESSGQ